MFEILKYFDWIVFLKYFSPMLIIVIAAIVLMIKSTFESDDDEISVGFSTAITVFGVLSSFFLSWRFWPEIPNMMIGTLYFDRAVMISWMIILTSILFVVLTSVDMMKRFKISCDSCYVLLLLATFGIGLMIASANLITLLIGIEMMSIPLYAMIISSRKNEISIEAGTKYYFMSALALAFFLMGLAFMFGSVGTTNLSIINERAAEISDASNRAFYMFGVAMFVVGFCFKIAVVPFHAWAPDVVDGTSTSISVYMVTAAKIAAIVAFLRFSLATMGAFDIKWYYVLWGFSAITMIFGSFAAMMQDNLKRMLAYSSIVHTGFILLVFPSIALDHSGVVKSVLFYLVAYLMMNVGAFAIVSTLVSDGSEEVEINRLAGLAKRRPFFAAALSLFLISLAGFPPTIGFFAKYYIFLTAIRNGDISIVAVAILISVVSIYYYLKPVVVMYFRDETYISGKMPCAGSVALHPATVAVLVLSAMAVIFFGIFPSNLIALIQASV